MEECRSKPYRLTKKLTQLFILDINLDTVLSASMYYLNEFMSSERTSIFIYQPWNQELTVFSSLDLTKHEISIPKSSGISGWVFENREPVIIKNAYEDDRFNCVIDKMTGFYTRNMICSPLIDQNENCLGTLQSLNRKRGQFTSKDLELMDLATHMVAIAITNSCLYNEITSTNAFQKKLLNKFVNTVDDAKPTYSIW